MKISKRGVSTVGSLAGLVLGLAVASTASAQATPGGDSGTAKPAQPAPGNDRGNRGEGRQRMTPEEFRKRIEDRMKEQLGATDDEWKVLQPRLEKVTQAQRATSAGRGLFGGNNNRGNRGRGGSDSAGTATPAATPATPSSPVAEKSKDLQTLLQNKDANADEIKAKLTALREARTKAKAELTKAQDDLREVLTARQESTLVMMGMLD